MASEQLWKQKEVTRVRKAARDNRGQALVEFALILPVIVFLLMAIMEGGRIFSAYIELQSVARDGARYASIHCTMANVPEAQVATWVSDTLATYISTRLVTLDDGRLLVEFDRNTDGMSEVWVELTLRYSLNVVTPIISDLTGNPMALASRMIMRSE